MTNRTGPTILLIAVGATIIVAYVLRVVRPHPQPLPATTKHASRPSGPPVPSEAHPAKVSGGRLKGGQPPAPEFYDVSISAIPMDGVFETDLAPQDIPPWTKPQILSRQTAADPNVSARASVLGLVVDGIARAYPLVLLRAHWVVNDVVGGRAAVVFWDPVAEAAVGYQATLDGKPRQFAATGLFYRGNALFSEAETGSLFLPVLGRFVTGPLAQRLLRPIPLDRCEWSAWTTQHAETRLAGESGRPVAWNQATDAVPTEVTTVLFSSADPQRQLAPTDEVLGFIRPDGKAYCCATSEFVKRSNEDRAASFGGARIERMADGQLVALLAGGVWPQQVVCRYGAWSGVHPDTLVWSVGATPPTGDR